MINYFLPAMNNAFLPVVADEIWCQYPDYRALSVTVRGFRVPAERVSDGGVLLPPAWMDSHIEVWRTTFRRFGANPKKTSCSVEALWKRLQKNGALPSIDPVVDLYNALSIRFGAPFGGEDAALYNGVPHLGFATGAEEFDTARDGVAVIEHPDPGEVIWRDELGVTCRRWNWRQCRRTALTGASENLWFVIDRLAPMPIDELMRAGDELVLGLRRLSPGLEAAVTRLEPGV
jgi:DNA/RNA-binding domain of Phe-tRNA-synthetase-like protein